LNRMSGPMAVHMPIDDGGEIPATGVEPGATGGSAASALPMVVGEAAVTSSMGGSRAGEPPITLSFDDLLPDLNGEIVVMGTGFGTQLSILTDQRICAAGVAVDHCTADGVEVSGLAYFAFEGGTKLYYSPDIELTIAPANG